MKLLTLQKAFTEIDKLGYIARGTVIRSIESINDMRSLETDQYEQLGIELPSPFDKFKFKLFNLNLDDNAAKGILFVEDDNKLCYKLEYFAGMCVIERTNYSLYSDFIKVWRETN